MLVLRRKVGEVLLLSGGVEIEIMGLTRSRVKLGIRAPKSVVVQRKEGLAIAEENQQASLLMKMQQGGTAIPTAILRAMLSCAASKENLQTSSDGVDK